MDIFIYFFLFRWVGILVLKYKEMELLDGRVYIYFSFNRYYCLNVFRSSCIKFILLIVVYEIFSWFLFLIISIVGFLNFNNLISMDEWNFFGF